MAGSLGFSGETARLAGGAALAALVGLTVLYIPSMKAARASAAALAGAINQATATCARLEKEAQEAIDAEQARLKIEQERIAGDIQSKWGGVATVDTDFAAAAQQKIRKQVPRLVALRSQIQYPPRRPPTKTRR